MMSYTPVIPPMPSPDNRNGNRPVQPPVVPAFSPESTPQPPAWTSSQQAGPNYAATYPTANPYGTATPGQFLAVPGMHPAMGSYFMPPVGLPYQMTPPMQQLGPDGVSLDWTGFPSQTPGRPPPAASPAAPPQPSWHPASGAFPGMAAGPPAGMFTAFQPTMALPPGYPWAGMAPAMATPWPAPGMVPGWGAQTPMSVAGGLGGPPPQPAAPQAPPPAARPSRAADVLDRFDKFDETPCYGPVLEPFLVKVVNTRLELNPLLAPPPDDDRSRPYLKWNMLFPTAQCRKSTDPGHRSWNDGRHTPATWPRVKALRLLCRQLPWELQVHASDPELGVTCGDVIESIHEFMYGRVSQQQLANAPPAFQRSVGQAYWHNRSTAHGVPGGRLYNTLLRCDWLVMHTMFGGIVEADASLLQDLAAGAALPCVFELKCLQRYPMTQEEIEEHREREERQRQEEERARRRSRATSRATSRSDVTSRAPSRPPSRPRESPENNTTTSDDD